MKYYLIVGEASGDLHASRLMRSLKKVDEFAEFRFFFAAMSALAVAWRYMISHLMRLKIFVTFIMVIINY